MLLGGYLEKAEKHPPGPDKEEDPCPAGRDLPPTIADLGLTYKESSEAQLLARLKAEAPEQHEAVRS